MDNLMDIFDPNTKIHGFFSLLASIGTIFALWLTINSLKETRTQNAIISKRRSIEGIFANLESILGRVLYPYYFRGDPVVITGKEAVLKATVEKKLEFINETKNYNVLFEYVNYLSVYAGTISLILSTLNDVSSRQIYSKQISSEFLFVKDHIVPLLQGIRARAKTANQNELVKKLDDLITDAIYAGELKMESGKIVEPRQGQQ